MKPARLQKSTKYSHIKNGKINPPKYHFSLKPLTEQKIEDHENNIKKVTLYASKVDIKHSICEHKRVVSPKSTFIQNNDPNIVLIGGKVDYNNDKSYINKSQNIYDSNNRPLSLRTTKTKDKNSNVSPTKESSKKERSVLKAFESLYSSTKDYFVSNDNKVPSRVSLEEIVHAADEVQKSLTNYYKDKTSPKNKSRPATSTTNKQFRKFAVETKQRYVRQTSPKVYPVINQEERRKIEEKLEMLHVNIRNTMDNLSKIENKDEKLQELVNRSNNLSKILKTYSNKINMSINMNNMSNSMAQQSSSQGFNQNNKLSNTFNKIKEENNEVDDVINVLKDNMSNLQVTEENKMKFDTSLNNTNFAYNSNDFVFNQSKDNFHQQNNIHQSMAKSLVNYGPNTSVGFNNQTNENVEFRRSDVFSKSIQEKEEQVKTKEINLNESLVDPRFNKSFPKINVKNVTRDDRFASYDVELPVDYYYKIAKNNEPSPDKEWYIRPHHTESVSKNEKGIADDIMNTKYISYYGQPEKNPRERKREEYLNEVISGLEGNVEKLRFELFTKANKDKEFGKIYSKLEGLKEDAKKEYTSGSILRDLEQPG